MKNDDIANGNIDDGKAINFIMSDNFSSPLIIGFHQVETGFKSRTGKLLWFLAVAKKKPRKGQEKTPIFNEKRENQKSGFPFNFSMVGDRGFEPRTSTV